MQFSSYNKSTEELISIYKQLLYPRLIEEKMLKLLRQGRISKWFSGIGQEAISVGAGIALDSDEWIMTMHRNLGVFTARKMPLEKLFLQWQGKQEGYSKGRERSFHFGNKDFYICGMISHLGPQLSVAMGAALAKKLKKENKIALAFTGEGGTSQGEFHEALNVASVWNVPVIFLIENNGYGLSTPTNEQFIIDSLADRGASYGMESKSIDGNNILEVIDEIQKAKNYCIKEQKPFLLECRTFRMRGHEEASGTKYVPQELFNLWEKKDPISNFEKYLLATNFISQHELDTIKENFVNEINEDVNNALTIEKVDVNTDAELQDVYAPFAQDNTYNTLSKHSEMKMVQAIQNGLYQSMEKHSNLILMGQDIAEYGGVFKVTEGFVEKFGKDRVRNTPLCESAILGAALGLSLEGYKTMVEMQFADFVSVGMTQIVNNFAKIYYRWGQNADVVVRMPTGAGVGAGPFHSQSNETWFTHTPGLKVVYPSNPIDAKGLLIASINDPNPVMYFEHKALYRSTSEMVSEAYYTMEIGKAKKIQKGEDFCIITYGMGVHWAKDYAALHPEYSIAILDLRTLVPLDYQSIVEIVQESNRVLILHEDNLFGGIGGELAAWIQENLFEHLDAPIVRCASLDTPIPFTIALEKNFLANSRLDEKVRKLMEY